MGVERSANQMWPPGLLRKPPHVINCYLKVSEVMVNGALPLND